MHSTSRRRFLTQAACLASGAALLGGANEAWSAPRSATGWMQSNLATLGYRVLRQLCMPGTHDAGMSVIRPGTVFAQPCNTKTQAVSIGQQLVLGARYFDIRPVVSAGQFVTGHYSAFSTGSLTTWQGANGQSIAEIVNEVNAYTAEHAELVILYLSHDLDTDVGNSAYAAFNQAQWEALLSQLRGLQYRFAGPATDLSMLTLNQFIGANHAAVVVILDPSNDAVALSDRHDEGFYAASCLPVFNQYANSSDLNTMATDQLGKLQAQRPDPLASYFLLSWTLTQRVLQAGLCATGLAPSLLSLGAQANAQLRQRLIPACTAQTFPNIIYVDALAASPDITALAMDINRLIP